MIVSKKQNKSIAKITNTFLSFFSDKEINQNNLDLYRKGEGIQIAEIIDNVITLKVKGDATIYTINKNYKKFILTPK